jgi:hypothetical protein
MSQRKFLVNGKTVRILSVSRLQVVRPLFIASGRRVLQDVILRIHQSGGSVFTPADLEALATDARLLQTLHEGRVHIMGAKQTHRHSGVFMVQRTGSEQTPTVIAYFAAGCPATRVGFTYNVYEKQRPAEERRYVMRIAEKVAFLQL